MFNSQILDVAVGILFIYVLVSAMCSAIQEGLESFLKTRAAYLEHGIRELLNDRDARGIVNDFFEHPQISSLYLGEYESSKKISLGFLARGGNLPSYIPAENFARAVLDMAARGPATTNLNTVANGPQISLDSVRANITSLSNQKVQRIVLSALDMAQNDINAAQKFLEDWYNGAMDRISGWYKRSTYRVLFCVGFLLAAAMNIDTLSVANALYHNGAVRDTLVAQAEVLVARPGSAPPVYSEAKQLLDKTSALIGWSHGPKFAWDCIAIEVSSTCESAWDIVGRVAGWLLTALAVTCGAPFWFDLLNKIMVIRSTVKPREKSQDEGSEDRLNDARVTSQPSAAPPSPAGNGAPLTNALPTAATSLSDPDQDVDCCEPIITNLTADEDLPAARGGIAQ